LVAKTSPLRQDRPGWISAEISRSFDFTTFGLWARVKTLSITLTGLSHTFPDDLDFLFVGPDGTNLAFWSDAGGGTAILKKFAAHTLLGLYGALNVALCLLIFLKLGWISVVCVFLTYFFMSIMFPTIFALGIFGLGAKAKQASSFIVMAIMGGAILPKLMGAVADKFDLSRGFIVPLLCFLFVAAYGFLWPRLSGHEAMHGVSATGGH
jgi:hypothetical protein